MLHFDVQYAIFNLVTQTLIVYMCACGFGRFLILISYNDLLSKQKHSVVRYLLGLSYTKILVPILTNWEAVLKAWILNSSVLVRRSDILLLKFDNLCVQF